MGIEDLKKPSKRLEIKEEMILEEKLGWKNVGNDANIVDVPL